MLQDEALDILKTGRNVFLTGQAGAGKTFLLNRYISLARESGAEVAVTASTGIAATHIGGLTIHSWSGAGIREKITPADAREIANRPYFRRRFQKTSILVIDEVSMLSPHLLNSVDAILRAGRETEAPFGGVQVVLCGDFFQLPPVISSKQQAVSSEEQKEMFFDKEPSFAYSARAWEAAEFAPCYLHEQYRQEGGELMEILNAIRGDSAGEEIFSRLQKRVVISRSDLAARSDLDKNSTTHLYTHNEAVDAVNMRKMRALSGKAYGYKMKAKGNARIAEAMKKSCLAPEHLVLKKDAVVMFVKNNFDRGFVNGTLGTVADFDEDGFPVIVTRAGSMITAYPESWKVEDGGKTIAEIEQVPLRLAWAITVHKSQGMTLDAARMDLSRSFAPGMGYVALSRVRAMEGLTLLGINEAALRVHPEVLAMDGDFRAASEKAVEEFRKMNTKEKKNKEQNFFGGILKRKVKKRKV